MLHERWHWQWSPKTQMRLANGFVFQPQVTCVLAAGYIVRNRPVQWVAQQDVAARRIERCRRKLVAHVAKQNSSSEAVADVALFHAASGDVEQPERIVARTH